MIFIKFLLLALLESLSNNIRYEEDGLYIESDTWFAFLDEVPKNGINSAFNKDGVEVECAFIKRGNTYLIYVPTEEGAVTFKIQTSPFITFVSEA